MIKIFVRIFVAAGILALITVIFLKYKGNRESAERIALMPDFTFVLVPAGAVNTISLPAQTTFVIFFNPGCEHCEYEGRELAARRSEFAASNVLMVSSAPRDSIMNYRRRHGFDDIPNFYTACDSAYASLAFFDVKGIPTVFIYDTERKLVKTFRGEVKIDALLPFVYQ
ncbi:MAG: redoxin domain-containing protein [Prevotellaceae bacterium]|jgi:thiol-disulfide isomerase/thioredoxin|nr:redoxin domain-containing protein [Prevotellaceae bacterium]